MSQASIETYGSDELGHETLVTTKSKGIYQHIKAPTTTIPVNMGGNISFEITERPGPNAILHDLRLKYRFQNTAVAPAVDSFNIPVSGIWSVVQSMRVSINGFLAFELLNRDLKNRFHFQLLDYDDVNTFLNERMSTVNQNTITNLAGARTIAAGATSPLYCSSFREVLGSLFRNRHLNFMHKIEIELVLIASGSDYDNTKAIGYSAGSLLTNLRISQCQMVCEYIDYNPGVPLLLKNNKSELLLPWYDYADFTLNAQGAGTVSCNLFTNFPQRAVINKLRFWITNNSLGAFTTLTNNTVYRNSFITSVELQRNGVRVAIWEGAELYKMMADYQRRRGLHVRDSVYSSTDVANNTPYNFVSFERDFTNIQTEGTSHRIKKLTGIDNDISSQWVINIGYDLTGQDASLAIMRVAMESARVICVYDNPKKPLNILG